MKQREETRGPLTKQGYKRRATKGEQHTREDNKRVKKGFKQASKQAGKDGGSQLVKTAATRATSVINLGNLKFSCLGMAGGSSGLDEGGMEGRMVLGLG